MVHASYSLSTWQAVKLSRLSLHSACTKCDPGFLATSKILAVLRIHEATSVITLYWVTSWLTSANFKCAVKLSYFIVEKCLNTTVLNLTVLKIKLSANLNSNRAFVFQVWRTWACWPSVNLLRKHSSNYNTVSHFNMYAWHTDVLEINIKEENLLSVTKRCTLLDVSHLYGVSYLSISLWVLKSFSWSDKGFSKNKQSKNKQTWNKQIQKISPHKN